MNNWNANNEDYIQNESESKVRACLKLLEKPNYYTTHDITIPKEDGTSQIDHVIVSTKGVFVIETKGHRGEIYGQEDDYQWTCINGGKHSLYNPLKQNIGHIKAFIGLTGLLNHQFISIIVFPENPKFKTVLPQNVVNFFELVNYIKSFDADILTQEEVIKTVGIMEIYRKERSQQTLDEHIKYVNEKLNRPNTKLDQDIKLIEKSPNTLLDHKIKPSDKSDDATSTTTGETLISPYKKNSRHSRKSDQSNYIKHGAIILLIIFIAAIAENKTSILQGIPHTSLSNHLKTFRELSGRKIEEQKNQFNTIVNEGKTKIINKDSVDYLKNSIGLPSVDQYNKLAKSKGDNCQIKKVDDVWQRVCE